MKPEPKKPAGRTGMIIGAVIGSLTAFANWNGDVQQAVHYVIVAAVIGWLIGYQIGKNRNA